MFLKTDDFDRKMLLKWGFSLLLPLAVYTLMPRSAALNNTMVIFLAVTTWAVCAWAMDTLNEIAVGLLLPCLYVLLCGVGQKVVYAPWLSEVPIVVIGGFILGKIIQDTGLGRRIALGCVRSMGGSFAGALCGMTIGAAIVAPLVPSIMGKAAIFCTVAVSLCDALDFKPKSREATAVVLATCLAVGSTKLCYLTGAADLVLGMQLADKVMGTQTTWMQYALHNFVPGMLYAAMSLGIVLLVLRSPLQKGDMLHIVREKYTELGEMSDEQKRSLLLLVVTLLLLATDSVHGISAGIVLIGVAVAAFLPGMNLMDSARVGKVNFAPLFFIMGCMCIGSAGGYLKVTDWLASMVLPLFSGMGTTMAGLCSYIVGVAVNFLLTPLAATTTLTSPMTALGLQLQMDPRILYYSFQYGLDNILFPYEYAPVSVFFQQRLHFIQGYDSGDGGTHDPDGRVYRRCGGALLAYGDLAAIATRTFLPISASG